MSKTFVIAEIGSAWRFGKSEKQHRENAFKAIRVAKEAGADCVKFQWVSDPRAMEKRRNVKRGSYDILAWPKWWLADFHEACVLHDIEFLCTVFLPADVEVINPYVKRFKVASLEAQDGGLLQAMRHYGREMIVSHGVSGTGVYASVHNLHCTASYPAPLESLNLSVIGTGYDGYSDHSCNLLTGALAVACGAKIVEVHFRLEKTPKDNPEYLHSHSPIDLMRYIENIRDAEIMLGDGIKKLEKSERWALKHKVKA